MTTLRVVTRDGRNGPRDRVLLTRTRRSSNAGLSPTSPRAKSRGRCLTRRSRSTTTTRPTSGIQTTRQDGQLYRLREGIVVETDYYNDREQALNAVGPGE